MKKVLTWGVLLLALAVVATGCGARTGVTNAGWTVVTATEDAVYAVLNTGAVIALNAADGAQRWLYPPATDRPSGIGAIFSRPDPNAPSALDAVFGAPVVEGNLLLVTSMDGALYAFQRESGALAWRYEVPGAIVGGLTVRDGVAYFGATDNNLYALDLATQQPVWAQPFTAENWIWGAPAVDDARVYVGSMDHHVYALDRATGEPQWRYRTGGAIPDAVTLVDGLVVAGSIDSHVYALDAASGDLRWSVDLGHWVMGTPLADDGFVYVSTLDGKVHGLNVADGSARWDAPSLAGPVRAGPQMVNGALVVGTDHGELWRVDAASGSAQRLYPDVGEPGNASGLGAMLSSPAIVDGLAYVGTAQGRVLAVSAEPGQGELWIYSN